MRWFRSRAWLVALGLLIAATGCKYTGWGNAPSVATAHAARNWLVTRQLADGGFEVSGYPGFETPDAVLALAEDAQQQYRWDTGQALFGVASVQHNGHSALDAVDAFAAGPLNAGQAAKLIVLVAAPLGLDPTAFDPAGNGAPRDLVATMDAGAQPDGSYGAFNATLYAAMAERLVAGSVPASTVALIRSAQEADGGWDYAGEPTGADADVDTTSLAIQALVAAGVPATDGDVGAGLAYLANQQQPSGAWPAFGSDDPNSTATAIIAVTAAGENPTKACWRDRVAPGLAGRDYASPIAWLAAQSGTDGHIVSPNDAFPPVNTFATTQAIEALRRGWLPITPAELRPC